MTRPLWPSGPLTEQPAVIGRLFAGVGAVVTLLWSAIVLIIIAGDLLLGIFAVSLQIVVALFLMLPVLFVVLPLLAAVSAFLVATVVWRHLVTGVDRLSYPRAIGVGGVIGLGSHLVLGVVLTILASGALVVGHVFGLAHLTWYGIVPAVAVLPFYAFFITGGIVVVTLGIPLVLPLVGCCWLTWRSRHTPPNESPTTA